MKTIAELKAEFEAGISDRKKIHRDVAIGWFVTLLRKDRQSLSQRIDASVAGCNILIRTEPGNRTPIENVYCKDVSPEQKCEGCKRLLKFKKESLEG